MPPAVNPYQTPAETWPVQESEPPAPKSKRWSILLWPLVFAFNLLSCLYMGWSSAQESGRIGLLAACTAFLLGGWALCLAWPTAARQLLFGAFLLGLTQIFPLLQLTAGLIAFAIAVRLGFVGDGLAITSDSAAALITTLVGLQLLLVAAVLGVGCDLLSRVWRSTRPRSQSKM